LAENRSVLFSTGEQLSNEYLDDIRAKGVKLVGYFCSYVPEELLGVKGLAAFRMRARNTTTTELADAYLGTFSCTYTRCLLETILNGEYDFLDGYIFTASCDHLRRLYDNVQYAVSPDFCHILDLPHKSHQDAIDWYSEELCVLRDALARHFELTITDDDIAEAIRLSNKNRRLLESINKLRKLSKPPITGEDMQRLMVASFSLPRAKVNEELGRVHENLKQSELQKEFRARVLLMGSQLDDPEYIKVIEDMGGLVVADAFCFGSLHYNDLVDETAPPMKAVAERYLKKISCPRMFEDFENRYRRIIEAAREYHVQGIIVQAMKFCDTWGVDANIFIQRLRADGFPVLRLEREYTLSGVGQMRTRVQAFLEMIGSYT